MFRAYKFSINHLNIIHLNINHLNIIHLNINHFSIRRVLNTVVVLVALFFTVLVSAGEKVNELVDAQADEEVVIEIDFERVILKGWDKDQIKITGELHKGAKSYILKQNDGRTRFRVNKNPKGHKGSIENSIKDKGYLDIFIPYGSDVELAVVNGAATLEHLAGPLKLTSVNGKVSVSDVAKRINLNAVNGKVTARKLSGKIVIETVNGKVDLADSLGRLDVSTVSGEVKAKGNFSSVKAHTVNGKVNLKLGVVDRLGVESVNGAVSVKTALSDNADVDISTLNSKVTLALASSSGAKIALKTRGKISNQFSDDPVKKQTYGPNKSLNFVVGNGSASVNVATGGGKIVLDRFDIDGLANAGQAASVSSDKPAPKDDSLQEVKDKFFDDLYRVEGMDFPKAARIYIADLELEFSRHWLREHRSRHLTKRYQQRIKKDFPDLFKKHFYKAFEKSKTVTIVPQATDANIRFVPYIEKLDITGPDFQDGTRFKVRQAGRAALALDVIDVASNTVIARFYDHRETDGNGFSRFDNASRVYNYREFGQLLRKWSARVLDRLEASSD